MAVNHDKNKDGTYQPVLSNITDWPIYKISQDKEDFIKELNADTLAKLNAKHDDEQKIVELIAKTLYLEKIRISTSVWKTDDIEEEKAFWGKVKKAMVKSSLRKETEKDEDEGDKDILYQIIDRYNREIIGDFKPSTYKLAKRLAPIWFSRLLNTAANTRFKRLWSNQHKIEDRIRISGPIEKIRELSLKGTILILPTHFSNLDSILIGWVIHSLGLPAVMYGAGLNLFSNPVLAYYMGRLGAYKIDRRKKNDIYIEVLKNYSRSTVQKGCHSLFFPGGTRSRSGQIEKRLKLGLLGTTLEAQKENCKAAESAKEVKKIYAVPLVLGYHFVLEASNLIEDYLKRSGKERYYVDKTHFPSTRKFSEFIWKFFATKSEIQISLGEPMDLFGNAINDEGESIDRGGRPIDIRNYFVSNGEITEDRQRDAEYTRLLGEVISDRLYKTNMVLSSHLIAYIAFKILSRKHRRLDLYGLLRLPLEERVIPYDTFVTFIEKARDQLKAWSEEGRIQVADHMHGDIERIIKHGMMNIGVYHPKKPLYINKEGDVTSEDMNLLYYYHNRLEGYDLIDAIID